LLAADDLPLANRALLSYNESMITIDENIITSRQDFLAGYTGLTVSEITRELRDLCKGSALSVDSFLASKRAETSLEDAGFRRRFRK
jgi:hypothetical protein